MKDIELVIKMPEEMYKWVNDVNKFFEDYGVGDFIDLVKNGTPLPKGHGDLIDVNRKITVPVYDEQYEEWEEKTFTVREALNRWSDEGVTVKDVVVSADKAEIEDQWALEESEEYEDKT